MKSILRSIFATFTILGLLVTSTAPAHADALGNFQIGPTTGEVVGAVIGIVAVGAAIGFGTYYALHHGHNLTGCTATGANGIELLNQGDQKTYLLAEDFASIKPGEMVRVSGKKGKKAGGAERQFFVQKLNKDFGPCTVAAGAR
jgi:hypothetical protein